MLIEGNVFLDSAPRSTHGLPVKAAISILGCRPVGDCAHPPEPPPPSPPRVLVPRRLHAKTQNQEDLEEQEDPEERLPPCELGGSTRPPLQQKRVDYDPGHVSEPGLPLTGGGGEGAARRPPCRIGAKGGPPALPPCELGGTTRPALNQHGCDYDPGRITEPGVAVGGGLTIYRNVTIRENSFVNLSVGSFAVSAGAVDGVRIVGNNISSAAPAAGAQLCVYSSKRVASSGNVCTDASSGKKVPCAVSNASACS